MGFLLGGIDERAGQTENAETSYLGIVYEGRNYLAVYLKLGQLYHTDGKAAHALCVYSEGLKSGLDDESLYSGAQTVISRSRDRKKLAEDLQTLVAEKDRSYAYYLMLALLERVGGDLDKTAAALEESIRLKGDMASSYLLLTRTYMEAKKPEQAIETLKKAETNGLRNAGIYRALGELLESAGKDEEAAKALEKALEVSPWEYGTTISLVGVYRRLKQTARAEELLKHGMAANPSDAEQWMLALGIFYASEDDDESLRKGIGVLEDYLEAVPEDGQALRVLTVAYMKVKDYEQAILMGRKRLSLDDEDADAYLVLAQVYDAAKKLKEAESLLREATVKFRRSSEMGMYLGEFLVRNRRKTGEGILLLEHAVSKEPENVNSRLTLAWAYEKLKKYDKALEEAKKVRELAPDNESGVFTLALVLQSMGKHEEAEKELKTLLEKEPNNAHANNALGYFYAETAQKLDEAAAMIQKALEVEPENGAYLDSLGWVYYQQGKLEEAKALLEKAFSKARDGVIAEHLGDVCYRLGQKKDAEAMWREASELDPWMDSSKDRLKLLEKGKDPLGQGKE